VAARRHCQTGRSELRNPCGPGRTCGAAKHVMALSLRPGAGLDPTTNVKMTGQALLFFFPRECVRPPHRARPRGALVAEKSSAKFPFVQNNAIFPSCLMLRLKTAGVYLPRLNRPPRCDLCDTPTIDPGCGSGF